VYQQDLIEMIVAVDLLKEDADGDEGLEGDGDLPLGQGGD
jgi:hypothetical protein